MNEPNRERGLAQLRGSATGMTIAAVLFFALAIAFGAEAVNDDDVASATLAGGLAIAGAVLMVARSVAVAAFWRLATDD